ncbi:MAG: amidase, partial [Rhodospirillales bacterium]|nr:amidase [Rhodospirillales bacterium]
KHIRDWSLFLERYPLSVAPVSGAPPFEPGVDLGDAASTAALLGAQTLLNIVPVLGLPAVSVPAGVMEAADAPMGLPLGAQIIAARFREDLALDAAEVVEARCAMPTPLDPVW